MRRHQAPVAISACAISGGSDLWDAGIEGEAAAYHVVWGAWEPGSLGEFRISNFEPPEGTVHYGG